MGTPSTSIVSDDTAGSARNRTKVLIAGGGIAALETLLALRALAPELIELAVLAPEPELVYRPVTVAEAFGRAEARSFRLDEMLADNGARHIQDSLAQVEPSRHEVLTGSGARIHYDALVIATGARAKPTLSGALTFGGRADVPALRELLGELVDGTARSVAFTLTRAQVWPLPLYELALLTATHLREHASSARVMIVTPEEAPLELFGPEAERAVRPMLAALGVQLHCGAMPARVTRRDLILAGGARQLADRVVTLPEPEGPRIAGLPSDSRGFIPVDANGRVTGVPDVYAAGDVTTFPFKQGGLASQQADAVAEMIACTAGAGVEPDSFSPVLRGLLITSGAPVYLRCEPQRLTRTSSVAIDEHRVRHQHRTVSAASDQALWWPPAKIAGRYLAPYLATARPRFSGSASLVDRQAVPGPALAEAEFEDAVELALLLADGDARWGDYRSALSALDAAEGLGGALAPEYESKRRLWLTELDLEPG